MALSWSNALRSLRRRLCKSRAGTSPRRAFQPRLDPLETRVMPTATVLSIVTESKVGDPVYQITVNEPSVTEGSKANFLVTVQEANPHILGTWIPLTPGHTVQVQYSTTDGTTTDGKAVAGTDYVATQGTLTYIGAAGGGIEGTCPRARSRRR